MDNPEELRYELRDTIKNYCKRKPKDNPVGREHKYCGLEELAAELGYSFDYFSNKLNGTNKASLTQKDILEIVSVFTQREGWKEWIQLSPQEEAELREFAASDL